MNWKSHLFISTFLLLIFSYFLKINLLSLNIIPLAIAILVFSLLPDIDHSKSKISIWFRLSYIVLGLYSAYEFFFHGRVTYLIALLLAIILFVFHMSVSDNSYKHRKFPHTFTFGIISSGILWIFTNLTIAFTGLGCFVLHLFLDRHIFRALKGDFRVWKRFFRR